jgi:hypothetical protein
MTDLIERHDTQVVGDDADDVLAHVLGEADRLVERPSETRFPLIEVVIAVLAGCSVILLLLGASTHLGRGYQIALLTLGFAQTAGAVVAIVRPRRPAYLAQLLLSVLGLALWAAIGPSTSQLGAAVVEAGLASAGFGVLLYAVLALQGRRRTTWPSAWIVVGSLLPLALIVGTGTAVLNVPKPQASSPAKLSLAAESSQAAIEGSVRVPGESSANFKHVIAGNISEQAELKPYKPLPPAQQALLSQQLAQAEQAAMRFPTVASAKAAGMILAGGMAPGVGAHYQSLGNTSFASYDSGTSFDPSKPASWIYASTADNAPVVGVMYESLDQTPPAGFVGTNDHWHRHTNVCVQFSGGKITVPFAADQNITPQECADVHGTFMPKTIYMVHAWVVPGWESPEGVFSHYNMHVYCPGNTDLTNAIGFCVRQQ